MGVRVAEKNKGSGIWWVYAYHKGVRQAKKVGDKREAQTFAKNLRGALLSKEYKLPGAEGKLIPTFKEQAGKWFTTHVEMNCKPATIQGYRYLLDTHVLPTFGTMRLDEITKDDIRTFCSGKKEAGMAPRSIRYMLATISGVYNRAIEDGLVAMNPASKPAKIIKVEDTKEKVTALTDEEVRTLLKATIEHLLRFHALLFTALRTGMRQGELIALKWEDLDWRGKFIEVRRSCWKGQETSTKSGKIRRVDMSDQLEAVLTAHRRQLAADALKAGRSIHDLVFPSTTWTSMDPSHIRRDFNFVLGKAKMRRVRFHDCRHTFASLLLRKGESPVYVQAQLGHHDISMTVGTYGHLIPGENRQAVNRLDDPGWEAGRGGEGPVGSKLGNQLATSNEKGVRLVSLTP